MRVEDHIRMQENADMERKPASQLIKPLCLMLTYERPGFLKHSVESFLRTSWGHKLTVFDDGSTSEKKRAELDAVKEMGVEVLREKHNGFLYSWANMMALARSRGAGRDSIVVVEDDVEFSTSWLDVLAHMLIGAKECRAGLMSCFRHYSDDDWGERVVLDGVQAVRSRFNTTQANIMPIAVAQESQAFETAAVRWKKDGGRGQSELYIAEELGKVGLGHFVTVRSYVLHRGCRNSEVKRQGIPSFPLPGVKLVSELRNSPVV